MPEETALSADADRVRFTLKSLVLEGNSVFTEAALRPLYADLLGKEVTLRRVDALSRAITQRYRDAGYVLARTVIPPQDVTEGTLRLQVVEGSISDYTITTDSVAVREALTPLAEKLIAVRPVTAQAIERYLLLMNDLPGLQVKSVLSPAPNATGTALITLIAERKRVDASVGVDTYGNAYIGPERINGAVILNGLIDAKDALIASVFVAPDHKELVYGTVGYSRALNAEGTIARLSASKARTNPSLPLALGGALSPEGEATTFDLSVAHPLLRSRQTDWNVEGGVEISRNATDYGPGLGAIETRDDQRIFGLGTNLMHNDAWAGTSRLELGARKGIGGFGASREGDATLSRAQGNPQFFKLTGTASRLQTLIGPFSALLSAQGQWANDPLLSSEQYGVGGQSYGRGYDASEITGDHGAAGKAELIWQPGVDGLNRWLAGGDFLDSLQCYAFYDAGVVWSIAPTAGQPSHDSLTSAGVGTRFFLLNRVAADLFLARPLTHQISSRALEKQDDWRAQFSLRMAVY